MVLVDAYLDGQGNRCTETRLLEYGHLKVWALGGEHTADNIQLRCRGHNDYEANRDYGQSFMAHKKRQRSKVSEPRATYRRLVGTDHWPRGQSVSILPNPNATNWFQTQCFG